MVKYCSFKCQMANQSEHKKACNKHRAQVKRDEALFEQPPQNAPCPICKLILPKTHSGTGTQYMTCCGEIICSGCLFAATKMRKKGSCPCPVCKSPAVTSNKEVIARIKKRMAAGDGEAYSTLAFYYAQGVGGVPQDMEKAVKLWRKAAVVSKPSIEACNNIGKAYFYGLGGVKVDMITAKKYLEVAAMGGVAHARHALGDMEGNTEKAMKNFVIAARQGSIESLKRIHECYLKGRFTIYAYAKGLQAYKAYVDEVRSDQRDEAATYSKQYMYYDKGYDKLDIKRHEEKIDSRDQEQASFNGEDSIHSRVENISIYDEEEKEEESGCDQVDITSHKKKIFGKKISWDKRI